MAGSKKKIVAKPAARRAPVSKAAKKGAWNKLLVRGGARIGGSATSAAMGALEAVSPKGALVGGAGLVLLGTVVEAVAQDGSLVERLGGEVAAANLGALVHNGAKSLTTRLLEERRAEVEERAAQLAAERVRRSKELDEEVDPRFAQLEIDEAPQPQRVRQGPPPNPYQGGPQ